MPSKAILLKAIQKTEVQSNLGKRRSYIMAYHLVVDKTDPPESKKVFHQLKHLSKKPQ